MPLQRAYLGTVVVAHESWHRAHAARLRHLLQAGQRASISTRRVLIAVTFGVGPGRSS